MSVSSAPELSGQPPPTVCPARPTVWPAPTHDPDERGYFGSFGGRWLPEALVGALDEVADSYRKARRDPEFLGRAGPPRRHLRRPAQPADRRRSG